MDNKQLIKKIQQLLKEVVTYSESITNTEEAPSHIEIDIAREKIRHLYEHIILLKNISDSPELEQKEVEEITVVADAPLQKEEEAIEQKDDVQQEELEEQTAAVATEEKPIESMEIVESIEAVKEEAIDEIIEETPVEDTIQVERKEMEIEAILEEIESEVQTEIVEDIATPDLFSTDAEETVPEQKSINEKVASHKEDQSIASRMQHNPISNLKAAIGINEKFLFINSLFEGNMQKYTESVDQLDHFDQLEKAKNLIARLQSEYSWNEEEQAYEQFVELVERRFQ